MNSWQIAILVLSIVLLVGQILNIIVDISFTGWAIFISWFCTGLNIGTSITLLVAAVRNNGYLYYRNSLIFLYISDILSLVVFIIFIIHGLLNWAKIVNIIILTAFIVVVHLHMNQLFLNYNYSPNVPQMQYQQMSYQQNQYQPGYTPNVQPPNYYQPPPNQPGYTASPNYGNEYSAPPV